MGMDTGIQVRRSLEQLSACFRLVRREHSVVITAILMDIMLGTRPIITMDTIAPITVIMVIGAHIIAITVIGGLTAIMLIMAGRIWDGALDTGTTGIIGGIAIIKPRRSGVTCSTAPV
jgi:hypothetical protein